MPDSGGGAAAVKRAPLARAPREEGAGFLIGFTFKGQFFERISHSNQHQDAFEAPMSELSFTYFPACLGEGKGSFLLSWQGGESMLQGV